MNMPPVERYLRLADSRSLDVLFWLLHNRDSSNTIVTTLDTVAKECGVTKVTVNRVFQKLYAAKFLTKVRNGIYKLSKEL